jgi:hypothetical protein
MSDTVQALHDRLAQITKDLRQCDERRAALADAELRLRHEVAFLSAPWPKTVTLYAYAKEEALWETGGTLGLTGEALRRFCHAQEYKLTVKVAANGEVRVGACDDIPLAHDDQPSHEKGMTDGRNNAAENL